MSPSPTIAFEVAQVQAVVVSLAAQGIVATVTRTHCQSFVVAPRRPQEAPTLANV